MEELKLAKPTVYVTQGLPGSGKSTYAKSIDALRVSLDDLRLMMGWNGPESWSRSKEDVAIEAMMSLVEAAVDEQQDVIVDNTHLHARLPGILRRRVGGRANFVVKSFKDVSLEECIKRDSYRESPVGEAAIRKMAKNSKFQLTDDYLNIWPEIEPDPQSFELPECIIVDLDGTLAIHGSRGPYEAEKCDTDTVDDAVLSVVCDFAHSMRTIGLDYKVFFMSGREGTPSVHEKTLTWLKNIESLDCVEWELHMREDGDGRPDFLVKHDMYVAHIRNQHRPLFVMDDRDQMVRYYRSLGIKTFQCGYGNF